jgi:hypothetical protein
MNRLSDFMAIAREAVAIALVTAASLLFALAFAILYLGGVSF